MRACANLVTTCSACPARSRSICAGSGPEVLAEFEALRTERRYSAGEVVGLEGDSLGSASTILAESASCTRTLEDGRTQIVNLLLPENIVGRPGGMKLPYTIVANADLTLCMFRQNTFDALLEKHPVISQRFLKMTLDELDAARNQMLTLGRKSARERIAGFLCHLAIRARERGQTPAQAIRFSLPLIREDMGNYLGLTIETVSRQLSQLKREGLIRLVNRREIEIPDLPALWAETGDEDGDMIA